jgi:hypothetical protein
MARIVGYTIIPSATKVTCKSFFIVYWLVNVTPTNNFNKFGGVTMLQDNNKTKAIEIYA